MIHQIADQERVQLTAKDQAQLAQELTDDMVGFGPLEPLLRDDTISDIMVNGPDTVFVEMRGKLQKSNVRFRDWDHAAMVAQKMVATIGRRVDESSPLCDARLPDGSRVNVIFPPLALDGPTISIRKFTKKKLDFAAMVTNGSMNPAVARLLEIASRCRLNILVSGGTGSGKTTLLNALSRMIGPTNASSPSRTPLNCSCSSRMWFGWRRAPRTWKAVAKSTSGSCCATRCACGPTGSSSAKSAAPRRYDMLQAMNTGHDGSISTVHANTTRDALARVENMVQMATVNLPARAIRAQIAAAVHLIIQIERMRDGVRRISQVSDICGMEGEVITMNDVAAFEFEGESASGTIVGKYHTAGARPSFATRLAYFGLENAWMDALQSI